MYGIKFFFLNNSTAEHLTDNFVEVLYQDGFNSF